MAHTLEVLPAASYGARMNLDDHMEFLRQAENRVRQLKVSL